MTAERRQLDGTDLKRLHREWRRRTHGRLALLLDGLGTPVNVGSIVRTAAAYGAETLYLTGSTPHPRSAGAQKTALGTDRYLEVVEASTVEVATQKARAAGYRLVGIELAGSAVPLHELRLPDAVCFAVGHEDHGLSKACLAACDDLAYVPQVGRVGSLNVATAAALALYEARRQEWTRPD